MDELTEPEDWKFEPLKDLDRLLRCSICFEYFKTAVMMPNCSHNYCSLCIRKHLQNRQLCPMCSKPVTESQLQCNRLIDNLVNSFKSNRNAFMTLLTNTAKNGLTTPSTIAMATAAVVGGASLSSPLRVPQPPSVSGTSILDLTDSELSQGLTTDTPARDLYDASHATTVKGPSVHSSVVVQNDEERRRVKERGSSSSLSDGRTFSPPAASTCSTATKTVVTAVVHPHTPGHSLTSQTSKTPSRRLSEGLSTKLQKEGSGGNSRGRESITDISISAGSGGASGVEPQASAVPSSDIVTPTSSNSLKVSCPVCHVEVYEKFINTHLDKCLNQMTTPISGPSTHASSSSSPSLKRLPKLVFSVMNDKQLRKQLKEYHLPTQGKREVLLKRVKEFTLLYNAECDALNPRTMKEIAQEVERSERSKLVGGSVASRKGSTPSSSSSSSSTAPLPPPPQSSRKSSDSEVAELREQYVKAHDEHFAKLIADVRSREVKRRTSSTSTSDAVTTPTNPAYASIHETLEESDSGDSPAPTEVKGNKYPPQDRGTRPAPRTIGDDTRDREDCVLRLDEGLEEDSQIVFASDSPSPPFLRRAREASGGSFSRQLLEETTSIPESPTAEQRATPASRKRASNRNKRSNAISLSTLYQDEEDAMTLEDLDFLPSNTTPFKARKKQKRH